MPKYINLFFPFLNQLKNKDNKENKKQNKTDKPMNKSQSQNFNANM